MLVQDYDSNAFGKFAECRDAIAPPPVSCASVHFKET